MVTTIRAPLERCFDLARSIDLHLASAAHTGESAVAGVTTGLIGPGQSVTWRARHLGVTFRLTSAITAFDRPHYFEDRMVSGPFRALLHEHHFEPGGDSTKMRDVLRFQSPLGFLGRIVDRLVLRRHLRTFLEERTRILKSVAESEEWRLYLGTELFAPAGSPEAPTDMY